MQRARGLLNLFLIYGLIVLLNGDLGVHCTLKDLQGSWTFTFYQYKSGSPNNCGYSSPNSNRQNVAISKALQKDRVSGGFPTVERLLNLSLSNPTVSSQSFVLASSLDGKQGYEILSSGSRAGHWSPLFDQGLILKGLTVNGRVYDRLLSYSLFDCLDEKACSQIDPVVKEDGSTPAGYQSMCDGTLVGWAMHGQGLFDCFIGTKSSAETSSQLNNGGPFVASSDEGLKEWEDHLKECRLNSESDAAGLSIPASWPPTLSPVEVKDPPREQGTCGSCYAIATAFAIESSSTNFQVIPTDPLVKDSFTNQGCQGGHPLMLGFSLSSGRKPLASSSFDFLGGRYGYCSEAAIQRHLMEKGPVVVGMHIPVGLALRGRDVGTQNFEGSLFAEIDIPGVDGSQQILVSVPDHHFTRADPWQYSNHAMVVVGWGEGISRFSGKSVQFWILRNSWGVRWGLNGHLLVERGIDLGGVESHAMSVLSASAVPLNISAYIAPSRIWIYSALCLTAFIVAVGLVTVGLNYKALLGKFSNPRMLE